jgi:hypothetical protein
MCQIGANAAAFMGIDDEPGDFVRLVGDNGFCEEPLQGNVGKADPRSDGFLSRTRCNPGEHVAGARRGRLGHQLSQVGEDPVLTGRCGLIDHETIPREADQAASIALTRRAVRGARVSPIWP